jgi:TDG/mug DNA glycosylase family protein
LTVRADTPSDVPDVLGPNLVAVFVGINPGRVSADAHAHFANPRNDFWRLLHTAAFTPRLLEPHEQFELLDYGVGVTNAAYRTTPGSGDLRRGDFVGAADRLERNAHELRPRWLAFVGKEAYRGVFGERAELGVQQRRLGETRLFVLPSTSPANAAVPWLVRRRWFGELAQHVYSRPIRDAVRALIRDPDGRVLLARIDDDYEVWWTLPGGGTLEGETDEEALRRELSEECGLTQFELGPLLWRRRQWEVSLADWGAQDERVYLVEAGAFDPAPVFTVEQLAAEGVGELRWFERDALGRLPTSPVSLAQFVAELDADGAPHEPLTLEE